MTLVPLHTLHLLQWVPMKDDPQEIADHLISEHGLDGAMEAVMNCITEAHEQGDMYRLSVWRDVRRILETKKAE